MALDRVTLFGLAAIFAILAAVHSPYWLAGIVLVAARAKFDAWARAGRVAHAPSPRDGRRLPLADATTARHPPYVIGDFLEFGCDARSGILVVSAAQIGVIIHQCAHECRRVGLPEPPMVLVMNELEPYCGGCALPYSPSLVRQAWRKATAKGGIEMVAGALPDENGQCPRCGSKLIALVLDL